MKKRNLKNDLHVFTNLVRYLNLVTILRLYQFLNVLILFHIFWDSNLTVYLEVTITEASEDDYEYEEVIFSFYVFFSVNSLLSFLWNIHFIFH